MEQGVSYWPDIERKLAFGLSTVQHRVRLTQLLHRVRYGGSATLICKKTGPDFIFSKVVTPSFVHKDWLSPFTMMSKALDTAFFAKYFTPTVIVHTPLPVTRAPSLLPAGT